MDRFEILALAGATITFSSDLTALMMLRDYYANYNPILPPPPPPLSLFYKISALGVILFVAGYSKKLKEVVEEWGSTSTSGRE
ncbi:hypothetical protein [Pyrococcus kukulkanii]|uniref:hypothetical protein n=1 Tax=Pyrococcus kukulkanii TaxID=1609559 RepID=UPI0035697AC8